MEGLDEYDLVERAQKGNRDTFGELVCRHRTGTISVIYRMVGDASLAEDAAQVAFIQAWSHLPGYTPRASFKCWLYRIAINAALDLLRRNHPALPIDDLPLADGEEKMEARLERRERIQKVRQAILSLPEACRAVLILREYEELSYQAIAETLDIPAGTVMSRLSYARKLLLQRLNGIMEEA